MLASAKGSELTSGEVCNVKMRANEDALKIDSAQNIASANAAQTAQLAAAAARVAGSAW